MGGNIIFLMARKSIKTLLESSKPYVFLALINLFFFLIPLSCNFYTDNVKIENTAQKMASVASSLNGEQNTVALTIKSKTGYNHDTGSSYLGVDVGKYNGLFVNCLQLTNGLVADDLKFSYSGTNLDEISYVLSSSIFSNHQGKRGILFDQYQIYLYSSDANAAYGGYNNFCYITERTAKKIMTVDPELKSYDEVINKSLVVQYGEITHTWKIGNIILDKEEFYSQMSFIYGDFILAYTHLPGDLGRNVSLSAYFGSNTYLNINKMNSILPLKNAAYEVYRGNLKTIDSKSLDSIDSFLNGFTYSEALTAVYCFEVGATILLSALFSWLYMRKKEGLKLIPLLISPIGSLILAYTPFWIIYKTAKNIYFLSHVGVLGLIVTFVCVELFLLALNIYRRKKKSNGEV